MDPVFPVAPGLRWWFSGTSGGSVVPPVFGGTFGGSTGGFGGSTGGFGGSTGGFGGSGDTNRNNIYMYMDAATNFDAPNS